jgi:carbon storage regulator
MLVLARRLNERIILPAVDVTIQVVALQGNTVRLGIEAPRDVGIYREEVYDPAVALAPADEAPVVLGAHVRNRLHTLGLGIARLQQSNLPADAHQTVEQLHAQLAALKDQVQALLNRQAQLTS